MTSARRARSKPLPVTSRANEKPLLIRQGALPDSRRVLQVPSHVTPRPLGQLPTRKHLLPRVVAMPQAGYPMSPTLVPSPESPSRMSPLDWLPNDGDPLDRVDWNEARALMKRVIAANLSRERLDRCGHDDLTQRALVGLMRAVARGGIRSLEALAVTIAKRAAIECMRRPDPTVPLPEGASELPAPAQDDGELRPEEAQLYMGEIMLAIGEECRKLFDLWCETLNMRIVAERLGVTHATARQRKVRCEDKALKICLADNGPLGQWARETKGLA